MSCGGGRRPGSDPIPRCCGSGVGQWLQLRLDPSPGNLHMPWQRPKKWQKKKVSLNIFFLEMPLIHCIRLKCQHLSHLYTHTHACAHAYTNTFVSKVLFPSMFFSQSNNEVKFMKTNLGVFVNSSKIKPAYIWLNQRAHEVWMTQCIVTQTKSSELFLLREWVGS